MKENKITYSDTLQATEYLLHTYPKGLKLSPLKRNEEERKVEEEG